MWTILAATVSLSTIITGAALGLGRGLEGWATKRDPGEPINRRKLARTVIIFTAAGILVAYQGDPITGENIAAETGVTAILGLVVDDLWAAGRRYYQSRTE